MFKFTPAQERAIYDVDGNMAVMAGAGAGKTRVLVERYLHLLVAGQADCDQIFAVTFTRKAAKEMRERIRNGIAAVMQSQPTAAARAVWHKVAQQLEQAPISTIHGLCTRLLRENPVEAVLDPNFAVLDDIAAKLLLENAVQTVLDDALIKKPEWLDCLFNYYNKREITHTLVVLYQKLAAVDWLDSELTVRLSVPYATAASALPIIEGECQQALMELMAERDGLSAKTEGWRRLTELQQRQDELNAAFAAYGGDAHDSAAQTIDSCLLADKIAARGKIGPAVKALYASLDRLKSAYNDVEALTVIPSISEYLQAVQRAFVAEKRHRHVLDYTDLEIRTYRLLSTYPSVCQRYVQRCKYLMVDEFQDTNELQRRIIYLLAGGSQDTLRGDKLFIVGDPKQSIYRFRGADVSVFDQVARDIEAHGGKLVVLDKNFRSVDGLLTVFNELFAQLMGTDYDKTVPFAPLAAFRERLAANSDMPCVELLTISAEECNDTPQRQVEAAAVARHIKEMVEDTGYLIDTEQGSRPLAYRDVAVLFASTTHQAVYEAALQANGVPYYVLGGRNFYQCQEIIDVINLLKVVDNHHDDTALTGVLRSPFFLLADDTLAYLKLTAGTIWTGLSQQNLLQQLDLEQQTAAVKAWNLLNKLRRLRGLVPIAELIDLAVTETNYDAFLLTQFMGVQHYANIQKLIGLAREYQKAELATLSDFLRYVTKLMADGAQEGEAQIESEQGNTVKLMTVHSAKGLEFPVVFLPDVDRTFKYDTGALLFDEELGLGLKLRSRNGDWLVTSRHRLVAQREKQLALLEMKRLLYVAMTRAKDRLVLSTASSIVVEEKKIQELAAKDFTEITNWQDWLVKIYGCGGEAKRELRLTEGSIAVIKPEPDSVSEQVPDWTAAILAPTGPAHAIPEKLARQLAPLASAAMGTRRLSPTAVNKFKACPRSFFYRYIAGLPEVSSSTDREGVSQSVPANLVGTIVHRCCELLAGDVALTNIIDQAVAAVPCQWRAAAAAAALPLLERLVSSDFYQELRQFHSRQELAFAYYLRPSETPGQTFEFNGSIDRMVFYPDGTLGIVDYKTDQVSGPQVLQRAGAYQWQMALYALAAAAMYKLPVKDARLYFIRPGTVIDIPVTSTTLDEVKQEMEQVCQFVSQHADEAAYNCNPTACHWCSYQLLCPGFRTGIV